MEGRPVWLVSVSLRRQGRIIGTADWGQEERARADQLIERTLEGFGDASIERQFRMNVTMCRHRALSADEVGALPESWKTDPEWHIAGSPIEVLWSRGANESVSAQPCHTPGRRLMDLARPDLWIPVDCGGCPPCQARARALAGATS